jgi:hypothetical protein
MSRDFGVAARIAFNASSVPGNGLNSARPVATGGSGATHLPQDREAHLNDAEAADQDDVFAAPDVVGLLSLHQPFPLRATGHRSHALPKSTPNMRRPCCRRREKRE